MRKQSRYFALFLAVSAMGTSFEAQARPDVRKLTCAKAQQMVRDRGAVVFTTSRTTYSLFVSNYKYCDAWERLYPQYAQTKDNPKCPVAYECKEPLFNDFWRD